jgi:apolipoprotein N-acyltransferase
LKKIHKLILSALSGLLLFAAWPNSYLTLLIFIAFVPLLFVADHTKSSKELFGYSFITMLIWNASTTWWLWNSTSVGAIAAIIANSLFMCLPWWGYSICKSKYPKPFSLVALGLFWLCFEYIHLNWELSWPWLTLGNVFANHPNYVQWYEYTGVGGGSLLVLYFNLVSYSFSHDLNKRRTLRKELFNIFILLLPIIVTAIFNFNALVNREKSTTNQNIIVVQPNIDPYQKFELSNANQQINLLLSLSKSGLDSNTQLIIWPETAMSVAEWQENITSNLYYQPIFEFAKQHPTITILSGIETFKNYGTVKETPSAHLSSSGLYYDAFNAAIAIKAGEPIQLYNKSKLVPGVESLPSFLRFMSPVFEQFGGSTGGYGKSVTSTVFKSAGTAIVSAPIICYESIYGEYVNSYVQKGANLLTIITNDGWWGNTPGHLQHLSYARLRAIETRRWVARSANTGISAIINDIGEIVEQQPWNKSAIIKYNIPLNNQITFYVRYGDFIFLTGLLGTLLLILFFVYNYIKKRFI